MLHSAQANELQIILDLCHFGCPDHLGILQPTFMDGFTRLTAALLRAEGVVQPIYTSIQCGFILELSGRQYGAHRADGSGKNKVLKQQLVRASLPFMAVTRAVDSTARFLQPEPVVHINAPVGNVDLKQAVEALRLRQFEGCDILCGREMPTLGRGKKWLNIINIIGY